MNLQKTHNGPRPVTMRTCSPPPHTPQNTTQPPPVSSVSPSSPRMHDCVQTPSPAPLTPSLRRASLSASTPGLSEMAPDSTPRVMDLLRLENENTNLNEQLATLNERLGRVLDHTVENDARLLQYTSEIFSTAMAPGVKMREDCSVQCDLTPMHRQDEEDDKLLGSHRTNIQVF